VANVVLIASSEYLPVIKERSEFQSALTFADNEALRALDVITRFRPEVVALDRLFAGTSRGSALINRIKADPTLNLCEIRIVPNESAPARGAGSPPPGAPAELDAAGTRRAPRFDNISVEVQIDGKAATLVDLSVTGAQVLSPAILRPNQRIRLVLPEPTRPIRLAAWVAWASFEMPSDAPARYRAGIEFFDADPDAVAGFYAAHKKPVEDTPP
jgi:hypothetical protein